MSRRGMRGSQRVTVLAVALLGVAVGAGSIAGCSIEEEPAPQVQEKSEKQESAPEPEPTEEETPEGPELPDKLDGPHVSAVLKYYDEYNKALKSGDPEDYLQLATDDCWSCESTAKVIKETFDNGGHFEGGYEPVLDEEKNMARLGDDTSNVTLRFDRSSMAIYKSSDADGEQSDETFVDVHVNLVREGQEWKIDEITSKPVEE